MDESTPSYKLFQSLSTYSAIERLISDGECESQYLECKAPGSPNVGKELRGQLSEAISGFSNTGGGVILWGVSTTKHAHTGLDVLTQIEPIGICRTFAQTIDNKIPLLCTPSIPLTPSRILRAIETDTRGVIVTYIAPTLGDPIQSLPDREFYFRNGDEFAKMPYEILKRMFLGTRGPDLSPMFDEKLSHIDAKGFVNLALAIKNASSAVAEHTTVSIRFENADINEIINVPNFTDVSDLNPGRRVFMFHVSHVVHRGLPTIVSRLQIKLKTEVVPPVNQELGVTIFANQMRAKGWTYTLYVTSTEFKIMQNREYYLY